MLKKITAPWTFPRLLRLALGLAIAYSGFMDESYLVMGFALFLVYQALSNQGCAQCADNQCELPAQPEKKA